MQDILVVDLIVGSMFLFKFCSGHNSGRIAGLMVEFQLAKLGSKQCIHFAFLLPVSSLS
jgi:hypothetical protein